MKKYITISILLITLLTYLPIVASSAEKELLLIDTDASCISSSCHEVMNKKKYIHVAGVNVKRCRICHEIVKEGEHRFKKIPVDTSRLCAQCHSETSRVPEEIEAYSPKVLIEDKEAKKHLPFAEGKCTECHDAHESNFQKLLKAEYPESTYQYYSRLAYALCFNTRCHGDLELAFNEPRTLSLTGFRNGNRNLHFKHVNNIKGRTCRVCHHHHVSRNPKLIRKSFQFGNRDLSLEFTKTGVGGTCSTTCHKIAKYSRLETLPNQLRTTPIPGRDATEEELLSSMKGDMEGTEEQADIQEKQEKTDFQDEKKQ